MEEQLNGIEGMEDIETDLLDAIGKGIAVSEILWGYDGGRVVVREIKNRHQKRFFWDGVDDSFRCRTDETPSGILLPKNKFIIHKYKARSGHPSRAGVLRVCAWMYLFKNYDIKDWISFAEVYGLPFRLGKYAPGSSDEEKRALMQALIQLGADAAGIIPEGASIEFVTTEKTSSTDLYERLARADQQGHPGTDPDLGLGRRQLRPEQDPQRGPARSDRGGLQVPGGHAPAGPHPSPGPLQFRRGNANPPDPL